LDARAPRTPPAACSTGRAAAGETRRQASPAPRNPLIGAREEVGAGGPKAGEPPAVAGRGSSAVGACRGWTTPRGRSWVFFSQDDIFMALALAIWVEIAVVVCGAWRPRTPPYKALGAATARAGTRAFAINTGAEAQASPRWISGQLLSFYAGIDAVACCLVAPNASSVKSHLDRCNTGPRRAREDTQVVRPRPRRRKPNPNLSHGWVVPDASVRMHRTAGACATYASIRSDRFGRTRGHDAWMP
jgi:hypothetical protein